MQDCYCAGVYADLDFESLRNLEDVLAGQQVVLAEMTDEDWDQKIPNAWLASEKGHPFWLFCIQQIIKASGSCAATNTDRCACLIYHLCLTCSSPPSRIRIYSW